MRTRVATIGVLALALTAGGCGSSGGGSSAGAPSGSTSSTSAAGPSGHLTVFAAASLKKTFTAIGKQFEKAHPGTTVTFSFAGSSDLLAQLQQGAPADVFASADQKTMAKATGDHLTAGSPTAFASNTLEIAVPPDNPAHITRFADLAKPGVKLVVCAAQVPCGAATTKVAKAAGAQLHPVSEEQSVTDVLGKVETGEADAGLVYVTDVASAGHAVRGVPFAQSSAAVNVYPVAALKGSSNPALARAFVDAVTGASGQAVLAAAGFGRAP